MDEDRGPGLRGRGGRAGPALDCIFFCFFPLFFFYFFFVRRIRVAGDRLPQYDPRWLGTRFGHVKGGEKIAAAREGCGKPLPWPFGPRVAV